MTHAKEVFMLGWRFIKVRPTQYIMHYSRGRLVRQGVGLSFFYFAPTSSLIRISLTSKDVPIKFSETTSDFQKITITGMITYKVSDPIRLSQLMNFTLDETGDNFESDDPERLSHKLADYTQIIARSYLKTASLKEVLMNTDPVIDRIRNHLEHARAIGSLGIDILDFSFLSVSPSQETAHALEAETREQILIDADKAIYRRRNLAVEQERMNRQKKLETLIALEDQKRRIKEAQLDSAKSLHQKKRELKETQMETKVALEEKNRELVALMTQNAKLKADAKSYNVSSLMKALAMSDPRIIQSLTCTGMDSSQLVALAFKEIAQGSEKINHFNISSEFLRELIPINGNQ